MKKSLIFGFGRAGRGLHLHCLRKLHTDQRHSGLFDTKVGVVDPYASHIQEPSLAFFRNVKDVEGFAPEDTVVHICTSPELHAETLRQAAEYGYTNFMIEKPLASTLAELEMIQQLERQYGLDVLVVANWLSSSLTGKIREIVRSNRYGQLTLIVAEQDKARLTRTLSNMSHDSALDVEIPHLAALALSLGGVKADVVQASVTDMHVEGAVVPNLGTAHISLLHAGGLTSRLNSNLASPVRKRTIRLYFANHQVVGYYPCAQDDSYSWLQIYDKDGVLIEQQVMYDDPLSAMFVEYYRYFDGLCAKPESDLAFNAQVVATLCEAKMKCGLMLSKEEQGLYASAGLHYETVKTG
ncbi:Gfo/Idh/MocA family protein [Paenibacillus agilis]|uniref:Gfo/Idh/MocA-like oxidoreductase N-terminal domain-containing protein n=1 Tax=Paenibacillus agilis TaxID=3020863 RepID=A0A559J3G8_9BACL|nr:Gfo/Idh/MocA family oxidoreductase [Paenibacillus agilis]TVX94413.1 hypothetical protein FPZ44_15935 [Paenibacillus agilis]